jgi:hypothetical protein
MPLSPLAELRNHGQAFWLDSLSRQMLDDGSLQRRIEEQGLSGVTSNPAIFAKAMLGNGGGGGSAAYDARIRVAQQTTAPGDAGVDPEAIYERSPSTTCATPATCCCRAMSRPWPPAPAATAA